MPNSFCVEVIGHQLEIIQDDDGKFIIPDGFRGLGGALKPAFEPALLFREPLAGNVAENVLAHGTGALNIDGCRVGDEVLPAMTAGQARIGTFERGVMVTPERTGRFPANLIHDGSDEVLALFPDSNGSGGSVPNVKVTGYGGGAVGTGASEYLGGPRTPFNSGSGSAARFFYSPKASKKDRGTGNHHPTVKPTDLMAYLCRLVTPPGGIVLDPFMGSGSTGKAAMREGFGFVGIEMDEGYYAIAKNRVAAEIDF